MPEQTDIYISSFPDAESITDADKVTGIQGNANKNFTFSSILAWFVNAVKSAFVPVSRTINGKTLDTNITLTATDVGAQASITASGILKGDGQGGVTAATPGADYQDPLTAGTDYATPAQLADKANQAQLATVESGSTASRAYVVGEYFCWNGLLYRVTSAISSGGTFTPGTNCEAVTVGAELTAIDSKMYQVSYTGNATYTYTLPAGRWFLIYANRANNSGTGLYAVHITGNNGFLTTIFETSGFSNLMVLTLSGRTLSIQVKSTYATLNILNFGGV